jgi:2-methylisocitrate lyase-like PEP mutase family enzyme
MTSPHATRARLLRSLHRPGEPLVLVNVWDVAGARLVEAAGAAAIATTSAGVAWSLGSPDGGVLDRESAVALLGRITAAVDLPVTADVEDGFAADADGVGETIRQVLATGAVGVNLEDGTGQGDAPLRDTAGQCARIRAARAAGEAAGVPLVINARTDTYLRAVGDPAQRLLATLDRAHAYLAAGADAIFVPGVADRSTIAGLVAGIDAPLNILTGPGGPSVPELAALGVARVSIGSSLAAASYELVRRAARDLVGAGSSAALSPATGYDALNALLAERPPAR